MDVRQKLEAGEYKAKVEFPTKPTEPTVFRKTAKDLTREEAQALPAMKDDYDAAMKLYREGRHAHRRSEQEAIERFRNDMEEENQMIGHPKAEILWGKAWEEGHSNGLLNVLWYYEDLLELVK